MVVVMKERASEAQVQAVIAHLVELGMDVHRSSGAARVVLGVVGSGKVDRGLVGADGRRARGAAHHRAVQARQPHVQGRGHDHHHRRRADRRRRGDRHGRAVLGRDRGAGARHGRGGEARRRQGAARRRLQAALVALQLPGPRRGGPADAARRRRRPRPEAHHRGDGHLADRGVRQVRRHLPGRRAQHAELHPAARARAAAASR